MNPSLKLISLNIEGKRHLERVIPFLRREAPDAICLQEVFEKDASSIAKMFSKRHLFIPMHLMKGEKKGFATFSRFPMKKRKTAYYYRPARVLRELNYDDFRGTIAQAILVVEITANKKRFTIGNTHFTWTPDGMPNKSQHEDMKALLKILDEFPDMILCGDFNIPRGVNKLYKKLRERYRDAVPKSYVSSLDMEFHRKAKDPVEGKRVETFMVDYMFHSKAYQVKNVRLENGLSDHKAIVGLIENHV